MPGAIHRPVLGLLGGAEGGSVGSILYLLDLSRVLPQVMVKETVVEHLNSPYHLSLVSCQSQGELLVPISCFGICRPTGVTRTLPAAVVFHANDEGCGLARVLRAAADQKVGGMGLLQLVPDYETAVVVIVESPLGRTGSTGSLDLVAGQVGLSDFPVLAVGADATPFEGEFLGRVVIRNRQGGEGAAIPGLSQVVTRSGQDVDFDESGGFKVTLVVGERQGERLGGGIGREGHLGRDGGSRVPVVAPKPAVRVVHQDVHGQGLGRVPSGTGEGDGGGATLDDGAGVGGQCYDGTPAGRVVDLDSEPVGAPLLVAVGAVHLTDADDICSQLVSAGLCNTVHVGIDGEFGMSPPGLDGHVVVFSAGVGPESDQAVWLACLDPDSYGLVHWALNPVKGEYDALTLIHGSDVTVDRNCAVACPTVGRVDGGLAEPRLDGPVLRLIAGSHLESRVVLDGPDGCPVPPVGFSLTVKGDS